MCASDKKVNINICHKSSFFVFSFHSQFLDSRCQIIIYMIDFNMKNMSSPYILVLEELLNQFWKQVA